MALESGIPQRDSRGVAPSRGLRAPDTVYKFPTSQRVNPVVAGRDERWTASPYLVLETAACPRAYRPPLSV